VSSTTAAEDAKRPAFFVSPSGPVHQALAGEIQEAVDGILSVEPWFDSPEGGEVMRTVAQSIQEADIVFADVTGSNPNVYYEIGLAHCFEVPVIAFRRRDSPRPAFDLQGIKYIEYEPDASGKLINDGARLRKQVLASVMAIREKRKRDAWLQSTPVADVIRERKAASQPQQPTVLASEKAESGDLRDGMWVIHPELGYGKVELFEEVEGNPRRFRVHFPQRQVTRVVRVDARGRVDFDLYLPPRQLPDDSVIRSLRPPGPPQPGTS